MASMVGNKGFEIQERAKGRISRFSFSEVQC